MKLPQYTRSDLKIMLGILVPYSVLLNSILFGQDIYKSLSAFTAVLLSTLLIKCISWQFHTWVAVYLRQRMPDDRLILKRIGTAIVCFFLMTAADNTFIVWLYHKLNYWGFAFNSALYGISLLTGMALNIFATLFHEGTANFEKWRATLTETEQLRTEYLKSRVDGLRSQIKPHFLFNSINTLSALIADEPERAEQFLNHMCKVYRYLLKTDDKFIILTDELAFINSYYYILKARYGDAIIIQNEVSVADRACQVPPFTLHLLLEDILQHNAISRQTPLVISITSGGNGFIVVKNTVHNKANTASKHDDRTLRNIVNKFRLLGLQNVHIEHLAGQRIITLPLLILNVPAA